MSATTAAAIEEAVVEDKLTLGMGQIGGWLMIVSIFAEIISSGSLDLFFKKNEEQPSQVQKISGYSAVMQVTPWTRQPIIHSTRPLDDWIQDVPKMIKDHISGIPPESRHHESVQLMMRHTVCHDSDFESILDRTFDYTPRPEENGIEDRVRVKTADLIGSLLSHDDVNNVNIGIRCWLIHRIWLMAPQLVETVSRSVHNRETGGGGSSCDTVARFVSWMIGSPYTSAQLCNQFASHQIIPPLVDIIHHYVDSPDPLTLRAEILSLI